MIADNHHAVVGCNEKIQAASSQANHFSHIIENVDRPDGGFDGFTGAQIEREDDIAGSKLPVELGPIWGHGSRLRIVAEIPRENLTLVARAHDDTAFLVRDEI